MEMDQQSYRNGQGSRPNTKAAAHEICTEPFPDWLNELECKRVEEYTDVNEAEKKMMILWNLHITKCNVTGDVHIPWACRRFVELHGGDIARRKLYNNFCLHVTNLFDFGLLSLEDVHGIFELYHSQRKEALHPMKVSGDEDVKIPHKNKRKTSEIASTSSSERSPLKRLSTNSEETEDLDFNITSVQKVPRRNRELSTSSKLEVIPYVYSSSDTKYTKIPKREKFPSFD